MNRRTFFAFLAGAPLAAKSLPLIKTAPAPLTRLPGLDFYVHGVEWNGTYYVYTKDGVRYLKMGERFIEETPR